MSADVIVIGAGPAGLSAAMYAARRGVRVVLLSEDIGGQAAMTARVENYPGVDPIDGRELMLKFAAQAEAAGAAIRSERAVKIERRGDGFRVRTSHEVHETESVVVAAGLTRRRLRVPGEEKNYASVMYGVYDHARDWTGRTVAVIGSGNSAMDDALLLAEHGARIELIVKHPELRGEAVLMERVGGHKNIHVHYGAETTALIGTDDVTGIRINADGAREVGIPADAVCIEIGFVVDPALTADLVAVDGQQQIEIEPGRNATNVPGLYAAGDITNIQFKQIVISAGEGAKAGLGAAEYVLRRRGVVSLPTDWTHVEPFRHEQHSSKKGS